MNELDHIGQLLADLPIYLANGILILVYWLGAHAPALLSLLCAGVMALLPDHEIQRGGPDSAQPAAEMAARMGASRLPPRS